MVNDYLRAGIYFYLSPNTFNFLSSYHHSYNKQVKGILVLNFETPCIKPDSDLNQTLDFLVLQNIYLSLSSVSRKY